MGKRAGQANQELAAFQSQAPSRPRGRLYRPPDLRYFDPQNAKSPTAMAGLSARNATKFAGSSTWDRTRDLRINSRSHPPSSASEAEDSEGIFCESPCRVFRTEPRPNLLS